MPIGLDINPFYQEQALYGKFIDWPALKADPLNFRFIWIKCAEGTDGTNYIDGAERCVKGAQSVHLEAINPYHYYLFQWCDWSSGAAIWRVISATEQAQAFYDAAKASGFPDGFTPMLDWEDPLIDQFLQWSDTASINKAIQFALKLNAHLKAYTYAVRDLFGKLPNPYSGKWWLDKWVPLLINNGYSANVEWLKELYYILADYDGTLNIPSYIPADHVIAWQKTSSPVPPVNGIPTGRFIPGDALDIDEWLLGEPAFLEWSGQKENEPMTTALWNYATPLNMRAWWARYPETAKLTGTTWKDTWLDGIMLPAMDMSQINAAHDLLMYPVSSFPGRSQEITAAGLAVCAECVLDGGYFPMGQHNQSELRGWDAYSDLMVKAFLQAIIKEPKWTYDQLKAKQLTFNPFNKVAVRMVESHTYPYSTWEPQTKYLEGNWQALVLETFLNHIKFLMDGGLIPAVPIAFETTTEWWKRYSADVLPVFLSRSSWLYIDPIQATLTSTATYGTLAEIFGFIPHEDFKPDFVIPDGYEKCLLLLGFTTGKQKCKLFGDTPVELYLWQDTAAAMKDFLAAAAPPVPPIPPSDHEARIAALEADVTNLETQVAQDAVTLAKIREYLHNLDNTIILGITPFEG